MEEVNAKAAAGREAARLVRSGMVVGLGTGSTAVEFIKALADRAKNEDLRITCVATSIASGGLARKLGLKVVSLSEVDGVDLAVDGADWIDSKLRLIKGGGGAHVREKVVDYAAKEFVVIADESKLCTRLRGKVPLEVLPFAAPFVEKELWKRFGAKAAMRPKLSDNGNALMDAEFESMAGGPERLEAQLGEVPGIVGNGLFTHNVSKAIIGLPNGKTRVIGAKKAKTGKMARS